jgi:hypothetical protein
MPTYVRATTAPFTTFLQLLTLFLFFFTSFPTPSKNALSRQYIVFRRNVVLLCTQLKNRLTLNAMLGNILTKP